jgi:hypothetical protein
MPPARKRFELVQLSFNIGAPIGAGACPDDSRCGGVTEDCNGPSCNGSSGDPRMQFETRILVERARLQALRAELQRVVTKFAR